MNVAGVIVDKSVQDGHVSYAAVEYGLIKKIKWKYTIKIKITALNHPALDSMSNYTAALCAHHNGFKTTHAH